MITLAIESLINRLAATAPEVRREIDVFSRPETLDGLDALKLPPGTTLHVKPNVPPGQVIAMRRPESLPISRPI